MLMIVLDVRSSRAPPIQLISVLTSWPAWVVHPTDRFGGCCCCRRLVTCRAENVFLLLGVFTAHR